MHSQIERRDATNSDEDFARKLHRDGYHDVVLRQFGEWDENRQEGFFKEKWKPEAFQILMIDGRPCGYVSIETDVDCVFISEIVIQSEFRGRGVGKSVLLEEIEKARKEKLPVRLRVLRENDAIKLYIRLGFAQTGETKTHILMELNG